MRANHENCGCNNGVRGKTVLVFLFLFFFWGGGEEVRVTPFYWGERGEAGVCDPPCLREQGNKWSRGKGTEKEGRLRRKKGKES